MTEIYSKALDKSILVGRIINRIEGKGKGPTVIFFGGIHGNEPAGLFALKDALEKINPSTVNGTIHGIAGNIEALKKRKRFVNKDLNRLWTEEILVALNKKSPLLDEDIEQFELFELLKQILNSHEPPFYFIDLHTTSSKTLPFITINDALINRNFSKQFPVPIVLGIEEYLNGPLLSYINKLGYVSLGFESGQHNEVNAIDNAIAFINLALVYTESLKKNAIQDFDHHFNQLKREAKNVNSIFEVVHLHNIVNGSEFKMVSTFESFQLIKKGTLLAKYNGEMVKSPKTAQLFMPLYQKRGSEGFFLIKKIKPIFLTLSATLRKTRADRVLVLLPGVSWRDKKKGILQVDLRVTRFFVKQLFHLFGYRNKALDKTHLILYNRERAAKIESYQNLSWFKKSRY